MYCVVSELLIVDAAIRETFPHCLPAQKMLVLLMKIKQRENIHTLINFANKAKRALMSHVNDQH